MASANGLLAVHEHGPNRVASPCDRCGARQDEHGHHLGCPEPHPGVPGSGPAQAPPLEMHRLILHNTVMPSEARQKGGPVREDQ
ncbi:hypothetical protein [Streptomyces coelicolor A3(2)]|uniref:Uncharacterized protein n=2 Tax=Streptomyces coelicolor TaxID=1902 RepID=Q9AD17_STRCO|nr:hypothetical protein [Streptomyces coelicolor]CAC36654.1 hypothetical protein [Streptomyces coelicolor A3(2)]